MIKKDYKDKVDDHFFYRECNPFFELVIRKNLKTAKKKRSKITTKMNLLTESDDSAGHHEHADLLIPSQLFALSGNILIYFVSFFKKGSSPSHVKILMVVEWIKANKIKRPPGKYFIKAYIFNPHSTAVFYPHHSLSTYYIYVGSSLHL